jgi:hypothetical protein
MSFLDAFRPKPAEPTVYMVGSSPKELYCRHCGKKLTVRMHQVGYDEHTGQPNPARYYLWCIDCDHDDPAWSWIADERKLS